MRSWTFKRLTLGCGPNWAKAQRYGHLCAKALRSTAAHSSSGPIQRPRSISGLTERSERRVCLSGLARRLRGGSDVQVQASYLQTRRRIDLIVGAAAPVRCLETNVFATATARASELTDPQRASVLGFLIESIQPRVILAHGSAAIQAVLSLAPDAEVITSRHSGVRRLRRCNGTRKTHPSSGVADPGCTRIVDR